MSQDPQPPTPDLSGQSGWQPTPPPTPDPPPPDPGQPGGWEPPPVPPGPLPPPSPPPGPPARPRLRTSTEIQGNILAAFNKDHQMFLFLRLPDDSAAARAWLTEIEPQIATTDEVETFNEQFSAARRKRGGDDPEKLAAVWVAIGLTVSGLRKLWHDPPQFALPGGEFEAFEQQAPARAQILGDVGKSGPENWVFGGPDQPPIDVVLTVAADRPSDLRGKLRKLRDLASKHGIVIAFEQEGETLPHGRAGNEHFGFKDGISQPGVRDYHEEDQNRPGERLGHPGTKLIAPGEFILGEPNETGQAANVPEWMKSGSFQVFRRLSQDVPGFWAQMRRAKEEQGVSLSEDQLAAKLVGRWRSGTPLAQSPDRDNRSAKNPLHDNDFGFHDDPEGLKTPRFAHVRKMYPRGTTPDRAHRIMRRGIPFGRPFDPTFGRGHGPDADRGLIFNIYCASIEQQFEFLQQSWANNAHFPQGQDGADPVIGQDPIRVNLRTQEHHGGQGVDFKRFVETTGAVYAFAPSKTTLRRLVAGEAL